MRTSPVIIERVAYWLQYFTLAEIIFVLEEDARMYPFDKFRVQNIALAVRHTFASDQSDDEVRTLIRDLFVAYCQTRPLIKPTSISSITIRKSLHLLFPFRSTCPICSENLNEKNTKQRGIQLYCDNGSVISATMFTLQCNHVNNRRSLYNDKSPITIYLNFIHVNNRNVYTHESLYFGRYVYVGGDVAVERRFAGTLNQQAINGDYMQLTPIDRRALSNILHAFLTIQLFISFGHSNVDTPSQLKEFNEWAWREFPHLLSCFIYLWTNHNSIIGSCGDHCSKCLVVDGHQKTRRRICAFTDVRVNTNEMKDIVIGYCQTPMPTSRYCKEYNTLCETQHISNSVTLRKKSSKRKIRQYFKKLSEKVNRLNATNCRTLKARSDDYISKCTRSFGLIALVTNCRIITSFSELYRSETLKEIINLFAVTFRVAGKLAPTLVYDDGCHLVKYVKNHIGGDLAKTPAMELFASTPVCVDRSHFRNHVGKFCREIMNPDHNRLLDNVNTQAAEPTFAWLKQYANIMSNMGYLRAPLFILILFNFKNMSSMKKSALQVFDVASLCPKVDGVSLCHMKQSTILSTGTDFPTKSNVIKGKSNSMLHKQQYDNLPKGITDWDSKRFEIINKNRAN